jgi:hypothetical protein
MNEKHIIIFTLLTTGIVLLLTPEEYQQYMPIKLTLSVRQIIGSISLLGAYYYFNNERLFNK